MEFRWLLETISGCLKRRAPASALLGRWCGSGRGDEMRSKDACSNRQNCANPADVLGGGKTLHDLGIGFKPVTSSLGISASIAYKGHGVHGGDTDPWSFSNLRPLLPQRPLNGVEVECKRQTAPSIYYRFG